MSFQRKARTAACWIITIPIAYMLIMVAIVLWGRHQPTPDQGSAIVGGCVFIGWTFIAITGAALEFCRKDTK